MAKELLQIQLAYFFKAPFTGSFEKFSLKLKEKLGDGNTLMVPLPDDAPQNIPRVTITFPRFSLNLARNRMDFFAQTYDVLEGACDGISQLDFSDLNIEISRMGFVKRFFIEGNVDDVRALLDSKFHSLSMKEASLRANVSGTFSGHVCNNIEEISTGQLTDEKGEVQKNGLIVMRDMNVEGVVPNGLNGASQLSLLAAFHEETNRLYLLNEVE